jgi:hypothetical protein
MPYEFEGWRWYTSRTRQPILERIDIAQSGFVAGE